MPRTKKQNKPEPVLVIEYHYNDGDVGAHPGEHLEQKLFKGFSDNSDHCATHIVLRLDTPEGQELSNCLHEAAIEFHKKHYLAKIKAAEEVLHKLEING